MDAQLFVKLYAYNEWANHRVWECVAKLTEAQFDQPIDYSIGSIHNQVAHIMDVEYWWFQFLSTGEPVFATDEDRANRKAIRAKWDDAEKIIRDYVASLTPEHLLKEVKPPFWEEAEPPIPVYEALLHITHHSADHRAQTLAALHRVGGDTTPQDYLFYTFDRAGIDWANE